MSMSEATSKHRHNQANSTSRYVQRLMKRAVYHAD